MPDLMQIYQQLLEHYGHRHWWPAETPFEVAVGAILTQNTNWANVEKAIINLRRAEALKVDSILTLDKESLEQLIRSSGFFRQKAERLQLFCQHLRQFHQGRLEVLLQQPLAIARRELLALKGIGPETADSILLYAGQRPSFVVDAYTGRLFRRLGHLEGAEKYAQIRDFFMARLPQEVPLFNEYHALVVIHGKECCRKRPICNNCPLQSRCHYRQQNP